MSFNLTVRREKAQKAQIHGAELHDSCFLQWEWLRSSKRCSNQPQRLIFCLDFQWKTGFAENQKQARVGKMCTWVQFRFHPLSDHRIQGFRLFNYEQVAHKLVSMLINWQQISIDLESFKLKHKKSKYEQKRNCTKRTDHQGQQVNQQPCEIPIGLRRSVQVQLL